MGWSSRSPVVRGLVFGLAAYLLGYFAAFLLAGPAVADRVSGAMVPYAGTNLPIAEVSDGPVSPATAAGWLLYSGHLVPVAAGAFPVSDGSLGNLALTGGPGALAALAVPPVALTAGGWAVAAPVATPRPGLRTARVSLSGLGREVRVPVAGLRGTALLVGYLPAAYAGCLVFSVGESGGALPTVGPDMVLGVTVAGLAYPIVFGGFGGLLAGLWASRRAPARPLRS